MFDSRLIGRGFQALIIVAVIYGKLCKYLKGIYVCRLWKWYRTSVKCTCADLLGKVLRSVTKEWFDNKGDLKAIEEARKNK